MKEYKIRDISETDKTIYIFHSEKRSRSEPIHKHDFIEIVYFISGESMQCIDGKSFTARRGDLFFINKNSTHSFSVDEGSQIDYINICFSPEVVGEAIINEENAFALLSLSAFDEMRSDANFGKISFAEAERREIESILFSMLFEYKEQKTYWNKVLENYLNILITKMLRKTEMGIREDELSGVWQEISRYIDENIDSDITLGDLASRCFYNPSYFSRVFKEKFGVSLVEYVNKKRIENAKVLLCGGDISIEEIAMRVGFSDRSNFYHVFSKYVGMSPSEYKRLANAKNFSKSHDGKSV